MAETAVKKQSHFQQVTVMLLMTAFQLVCAACVLCRQEELSLSSRVYGTPILPQGKVLMEIKCAGGIPLWMTKVLSEEKIYKTTFSKYGIAYKTLIFPQSHPVNPYQMLEVTTNA